MGYIAVPQVPMPPAKMDLEAMTSYIKQLYNTLVQWQLVIGHTNFLGADGYLTISDNTPTSTDGHDNDIWVEY